MKFQGKRLAKLHAKLADTRTDFLHKLSTQLIRENQTIVLEDLNVSGMVRNRKLSRAISDLGWRTLRTFLEAKSENMAEIFESLIDGNRLLKPALVVGLKSGS
jgi:putative transposase